MIIRYYSSSVFMGHGEPSYGGDENACCGVGHLSVLRWPIQRAAFCVPPHWPDKRPCKRALLQAIIYIFINNYYHYYHYDDKETYLIYSIPAFVCLCGDGRHQHYPQADFYRRA